MHTTTDLNALTILYQDEHLVAIHKPAGLLVHRSPIDRHETQFAMQMTRDLIQQSVYTLHRLDKATSGLLLFALDSTTAATLSQQFSTHLIEKSYLAITRGWTSAQGQIEHPLQIHYDKIADKDKQTDKAPQSALTYYKTLDTVEINHTVGKYTTARYSLIELNPKTGRKHQLRRHLNAISHPIIGDVEHGDRHHNHFFYDWLGQHRLYLAATSLTFTHPATQQKMTIDAPLEPSFQLALNQLNLHA